MKVFFVALLIVLLALPVIASAQPPPQVQRTYPAPTAQATYSAQVTCFGRSDQDSRALQLLQLLAIQRIADGVDRLGSGRLPYPTPLPTRPEFPYASPLPAPERDRIRFEFERDRGQQFFRQESLPAPSPVERPFVYPSQPIYAPPCPDGRCPGALPQALPQQYPGPQPVQAYPGPSVQDQSGQLHRYTTWAPRPR
jgi:hypothetical protein